MDMNRLQPEPSRVRSESVQPKTTQLIRFGFIGGLVMAIVCLIFTMFYIYEYSRSCNASLEKHVSEYLIATNANNLDAVIMAVTMQQKLLLLSCGIVSGVAFGFLGFSLFLLGVEGEVDFSGKFVANSFLLKKLAPGALIIIAAMVLIGYCSLHEIVMTSTSQGPVQNGGSSTRGASTIEPTKAVPPKDDSSRP